ncbi:MAG: F0F1 ATP synthase subunit delta [Bifidobacteriaceae bacterium]|jgi:F-type H+-transporting ATPase subunit delta|nr:F0F1 ATP synthase subunit delta [Bifidobacteriaceae bacterium]
MHGETSLSSEREARQKFAEQIRTAGAAAREVGEQLFSFSALLDQTASVERAITDPSRPAADKITVVNDLLAGSAAQELTGEILKDLAARRWSRVDHISNAVEDLAIDCILSAADAAKVTDTVALELAQIHSAILNLPVVRQRLSDTRATAQARVKFFHELFDDQHLNDLTVVLAEHATRELRQRRFASTIQWLVAKVSEHMGESVVTVTSAVALSDSQVQRIVDIYTRKMGRPVHVNQVIDARVMGGMRIQAGSEVTDNTVVAQLSNLKRMVK